MGSLVLGFRRPEHLPTALIGIGAGVAATLSAAFVLKHYDPFPFALFRGKYSRSADAPVHPSGTRGPNGLEEDWQ
jgi:hypothetical protein